MSRNLKLLITLSLFIAVCLSTVYADAPPDPGGGPGSGDPPVGGGSPIGGGLIPLLMMAGIYGFNKIRLLVKSNRAE